MHLKDHSASNVMNRTDINRLLLLVSLLVLATTLLIAVPQQEVLRREISRSTEKEVAISLDAAFGTLNILKGDRSKIVAAEYRRDENDKRQLEMFYNIEDGRGNLEINLTDEKKHKERRSSSISWEELKGDDSRADERQLTAKLTDALPLSLKIGIGAGRGNLDLTGLMIKNLKVSAGASSATLRCDEPNPISCETISIESGVSKFSASHLTNLNFRKLKFSGGVGAYTLDFAGELQQKAYAEIDIGLGAITVYIPKDLPARIITEDSWFSSVDVDDCYEKTRKNSYESENFTQNERSLTIKIGSGLGSIKVRCR
jgi:hypothetical protein